jgi:hypothetical protein
MQRLLMIALIALIGVLPLVSGSAQAQTETAVPTAASGNGPLYPIVVGLGAIAGVAVYNIASFGVSGVPYLAPAATTGAMVTAAAIAQNRLYTVVSAVVGAWVANWLYGN